MALITPLQLFGTGYTSDGTSITIPLASLSGLTAADANKDTGNAMEVLRLILEKYSAVITGLAPTARSSSSSIEKPAPSLAFGQNISPGTLKQTFVISFNLVPTSLELSTEG